MQDKKWFTISEAAKYLGVSPDSLRRWEKAGKIASPIRTAGGARRYTKELLEEILGGSKKETTAKPVKKRTFQSSGSNKKTFIIGFTAVIITLAILLPVLFLFF